MPLGTEVGLGSGDIVLDGDPARPTERGTAASHFSAHVHCGQTAGWIRGLGIGAPHVSKSVKFEVSDLAGVTRCTSPGEIRC